MKRSIRVLGLLLALCVLLSTVAFAAETQTCVIDELDLAITFPEDWEVYDKSAIWELLDPSGNLEELLQECDEEIRPTIEALLNSFYLLAGKISNVTEDLEDQLFCEVIALDANDFWQMYLEEDLEFDLDLDALTDEELELVADAVDQVLNEIFQKTLVEYLNEELHTSYKDLEEAFGLKLALSCVPYRNEQSVFLAVTIEGEIENSKGAIVVYYNFRDGKIYGFGFFFGGAATEERLTSLQEIMDSVRFNQSTYSPSGFVDVKGHWSEENITKAAKLGLFTGSGDQKFYPNDGMTRAMLVQVLHRLAGEPEAEPAQFADVAENAWYAKAVAWAAENGIVEGDEGLFRPNDLVKRQELAAILYRYNASAVEDAEAAEAAEEALAAFADAAAVAQWAQAPVAWAVEQGLLNGSDGSLLPAKTATRAEVAAILVRYLEAE